jgi:hypothetical protein
MTMTAPLAPMTFEQFESLSRAASKAVTVLVDLHDEMLRATKEGTIANPALTDTVDRVAGKLEEWEATLTYGR